MNKSSAALSTYHLEEFQPHPVAEAKQVDVEIAEDAAVSRLLPIQDGPDQRMEHRSSAESGIGGRPSD
jgi:hypothetical protein